MKLDLLNGYKGRSRAVDTLRYVNLYPEYNSQGSKSIMTLVATPGLTLFNTVSGVTRGVHEMGNLMYVVSDGTLWEVNAAGVSTSRGTLDTTSGRVSMDDNGTQLMIVDGTSGYIYTPSTTTFTKITDADFPTADFVDFIDGYFVVNVSGTGQFQISDAYDGLAWDALNFATAEGDPDNLLRPFVDHQELWLFSDRTTEVWYNSGAADFPFTRMQGAFIELGCAAPWSVAKSDNSVFWLAKSDRGEVIVARAQGYQPQRISNHAVEYAIDSYSVVSDAFGFAYTEEGHAFYVLTFPTEGKTWVYDSATEKWHERMSIVDGSETRWVPDSYVFFNNEHHVSDYRNGNIYQISHSEYTENGDMIARDLFSNHLDNDEERVFINLIEMVCERGVGTATGQGSDPQAMLRTSHDGGYTYGNERWRSMGQIGEKRARVKWNRCGMARDFAFHIRITDPVKVIVNGLTVK